MHNPPHPASILREDALPELKLTVTEAARQLGVSRVLNERAGISADLALRLEQWIKGPLAALLPQQPFHRQGWPPSHEGLIARIPATQR